MKQIFAMILAVAAVWLPPCGCSRADVSTVALVPEPAQLVRHAGEPGLSLAGDFAVFAVDSAFAGVCEAFVTDAAGRARLSMAGGRDGALITVERGSGPVESYTLKIDSDGVRISAADEAGAVHALSTLHQLMAENTDCLPALEVADAPVWGHRGLMLDVSRHFRTVDEVKSLIGTMSLFKLNVLHLHLSDNQGWRLCLDKYPDVAERGTYYYDFPERSGKYYTHEELKDLVKYAAVRGVEIIPEIDMPGHCLSLLAAKPEFACRGGEFEAYQDEREQKDRKRLGENMICVGNEAVFDFIGDMLDELVEIFPSRYIHMGGDEVSTHVWRTCPRCRALYSKLRLKDYGELQDYFTSRVSRMVSDRGRVMMGWEEINDREAASPSDVLTIWKSDAYDVLAKAAGRGMDVVMCPKDPCYFDYGYARNPSGKIYSWNVAGENADSLMKSHIRGAQACLWTEFVPEADDMNRMLFPRLCALAEVLWSPDSVRDWAGYVERMAVIKPWLADMGIAMYEGENAADGWFDAASHSVDSVKPVIPAEIETNMYAIEGYEKEYAFDGDTTTFYSSPYSHVPGDYIALKLDELRQVTSIRVICDDSQDHFTEGAELSVSADGESYAVVAEPDASGRLQVEFDGPRDVKAVRIEMTKSKNSRLTIKEIELK